MTDAQIAAACDTYGVKAVSDAAYKRMQGDRAALSRVGLDDVPTLAEANHITIICYRLMSPDERAADLTDAAIDTARLPRT